jgi:hypothetical protein
VGVTDAARQDAERAVEKALYGTAPAVAGEVHPETTAAVNALVRAGWRAPISVPPGRKTLTGSMELTCSEADCVAEIIALMSARGAGQVNFSPRQLAPLRRRFAELRDQIMAEAQTTATPEPTTLFD